MSTGTGGEVKNLLEGISQNRTDGIDVVTLKVVAFKECKVVLIDLFKSMITNPSTKTMTITSPRSLYVEWEKHPDNEFFGPSDPDRATKYINFISPVTFKNVPNKQREIYIYFRKKQNSNTLLTNKILQQSDIDPGGEYESWGPYFASGELSLNKYIRLGKVGIGKDPGEDSFDYNKPVGVSVEKTLALDFNRITDEIAHKLLNPSDSDSGSNLIEIVETVINELINLNAWTPVRFRLIDEIQTGVIRIYPPSITEEENIFNDIALFVNSSSIFTSGMSPLPSTPNSVLTSFTLFLADTGRAANTTNFTTGPVPVPAWWDLNGTPPEDSGFDTDDFYTYLTAIKNINASLNYNYEFYFVETFTGANVYIRNKKFKEYQYLYIYTNVPSTLISGSGPGYHIQYPYTVGNNIVTELEAKIKHNALQGLQGGLSTTEQYHLTSTQHDTLTGGINVVADSQHAHSHNALHDLQGGLPTERYHLTLTQRDILTDEGGIVVADSQHAHSHNALHDLQGGSTTERYHLTSTQHAILTGSAGIVDANSLHRHANLLIESDVSASIGTLSTGNYTSLATALNLPHKIMVGDLTESDDHHFLSGDLSNIYSNTQNDIAYVALHTVNTSNLTIAGIYTLQCTLNLNVGPATPYDYARFTTNSITQNRVEIFVSNEFGSSFIDGGVSIRIRRKYTPGSFSTPSSSTVSIFFSAVRFLVPHSGNPYIWISDVGVFIPATTASVSINYTIYG